jgi:hypothetical protein
MSAPLSQAFCCDGPAVEIAVAVSGYIQINPATNHILSTYTPVTGVSVLTPTSSQVSVNGASLYVMQVRAALVPGVVSLADGTTVPVNAAQGNDFRWTLTGNNHTLSSPTNSADGQKIVFQVTQPASGGPYTIQYGTNYLFSASLPAPVLSIGASYTDLLGFIYNAALGKWLFVAFVGGL